MTLFNTYANRIENPADRGTAALIVLSNGGVLSKEQRAGVQQAYSLFRLLMSSSPAGYRSQNKFLPDGTRIRMESNNGFDRVFVWPPNTEFGMTELLHGFGVKPNWHSPVFITEDGPKSTPVQLASGQPKYNHVTRKVNSTAYNFFEPMVLDPGKKWTDFTAHAGTSASGTFIMPICVMYGDTSTHVPHDRHVAADKQIVNEKGEVLYTMTDIDPIGIESNPINYAPPATDAEGNRVVVQQWRKMETSPTFAIYHFRFGSEVLQRTGKNTYTLATRTVSEFSTQMKRADPPATAQSGPTNTLPTPFQHSWGVEGNASINMSGYTLPYAWGGNIVYGVSESDVDLTGQVTTTISGTVYRLAPAGAAATTTHAIALPDKTDIKYLKINNNLAYTPTVKLDAASKVVSVAAMTGVYGPTGGTIYERKIDYVNQCQPYLELDFDWTKVKMLEASFNVSVQGDNSSVTHTSRNYYTDIDYTNWIGRPYSTLHSFTGSDVNAIVLEAYATHVPYDELAVQYPHGSKLISESIAMLFETAEYTYKSRYIIDYDQRARFYAAIRVEVRVTEGRWDQQVGGFGVYDGLLSQTSAPKYEVKVYFESKTADHSIIERLLETDSFTRFPTEFRMANPYPNIYKWPDDDTLYPMNLYFPPELQPSAEGWMMVENIFNHQGFNTHFAASDAIDVGDKTSETDLERSSFDGVIEYPHKKRPTGSLYVRTFSLAEVMNALWMLDKDHLKVDCPHNTNYDTPDSDPWYYAPAIGAAVTDEKKYHVEIKDGDFHQWSDNIEGAPSDPNDREIEVYFV